MSTDASVNIICLKWGTRYPARYTNILYASVKRHLHRPFRFVCFTDDASELDPGIDPQPLPEYPDERVLAYGNPDPDVALQGFKAKRIHNSTKPCPWILDDWHL